MGSHGTFYKIWKVKEFMTSTKLISKTICYWGWWITNTKFNNIIHLKKLRVDVDE
jgi:hypothetical protein